MNQDKSVPTAETFGWRYCYECTSPTGARMVTMSESEAFFWHSLGYEILRLVERTDLR